MIAPSLTDAILSCASRLRDMSMLVHTQKWQGMNIEDKPEMATYEVLNHSFTAPMVGDKDTLATMVRPNLPWSEDHFQERIGKEPLNPGVEWANWPYAKSADRFRTEGNQQFSHSYMERMWPRWAGQSEGGRLDGLTREPNNSNSNFGIRYRYGDLDDLIHQLVNEPDTRQAYLPLWFPEDTGVTHGGRVPCTLGYHFIRRGDLLHMTYYLRSCDFARHFRDDVYLAVRLAQWILSECRKLSPDDRWKHCQLGLYTMHMVSLHVFRNDYRMLFNQNHPRG